MLTIMMTIMMTIVMERMRIISFLVFIAKSLQINENVIMARIVTNHHHGDDHNDHIVTIIIFPPAPLIDQSPVGSGSGRFQNRQQANHIS